jgi:hypothetical protein
MKFHIFTLLLCTGWCCKTLNAGAQDEWPRIVSGADGSVFRIYQPQPDSLRGDILSFRAAFSVTEKGKRDTLYGTFRALAVIRTDRDNRLVSLPAANIVSMHLSNSEDPDKTDDLKEALECGIPGAGINIPLDELVSCLHQPIDEGQLSKGLKNEPPRIILAGKPSMLVLIDGVPRFRRNPEWEVNVVANSPNIIVESEDGWYYLCGGRHWYIAPMPEGPYHHTTDIPSDLKPVQQALESSSKPEHSDTLREGADIVKDIFVSLTPAALIQTGGEPVYDRIRGTSLLYVSNSNNDIFSDTVHRHFYVLLSGRWYRSPYLITGAWKYVPADSLPPDFAQIPEGSAMDHVLACVAGTDAAREAVQDACIPQTGRIDRTTVRAKVHFDGAPKFEEIPGTSLAYALNSPEMVLRFDNYYFCVDNGVWFTAATTSGPWIPATERPEDVRLLQPDCPVYPSKFVYIYGYTTDYIYAGYTLGYLNAYIDGQTLVYGTGYYYGAWMQNAYYPCRRTWGFGMWYNPWFGWCLSYDVGPDWLNSGIGRGSGYWTGGWWGPPLYRPPYIWHHFAGHGTYEQDIRRVQNVDYANNLYRRWSEGNVAVTSRVLYMDGDGEVYCRSGRDFWQCREGENWVIVEDPILGAQLDRQERLVGRGRMRVQNFLEMRGVRQGNTVKAGGMR